MAKPLKQLKKSDGTEFYPVTGSAAVYREDGSTVESALSTIPTSLSSLANTSGSFASLCTCATAAATAAKVVTVDSGDSNWTLRKGAIIGVKFTYTNTASNVTINVNSTGAKNIWYSGAKYTGNTSWIAGTANRYSYYMYDGTYWVWISGGVDVDNDNIPQAISWTGATTAAKTASMTSYSAVANHYTVINLIYGNTAASAITLNINGKGAKPVYIDGSASSSTNYSLSAGTYIIWYDGTNYYFNSDGSIPKVKCANAITFTGASTGTYDGSSTLTINIPEAEAVTDLIDKIYPVGSIYMSMSSTNPGTLFGGTWEQIKGRFLLGTGTPDDNANAYWGTDLTWDGANKINQPAGDTGGETRHTLTVEQMPSHTHTTSQKIMVDGSAVGKWGSPIYTYSDYVAQADELSLSSVGGGQAHSNMPPYLAVYIWKRTA